MSSPPHAVGHNTFMCNDSWMISWHYNIPSMGEGLEPYTMPTDAHSVHSVLPPNFDSRLPSLPSGIRLYQLC